MSDQEVSLPAEPRPGAAPAGARGPLPQAAEVYADVSNRLVALGIDAVLLSAIALLGAIAVSLTVGPVVRIEGSSVEVDQGVALVDALVTTLLGAVYFAGAWARYGRTPGQRLLGIRVVGAGDGKRISPARALVRWLLLAAPFGIASVLTTAVVSGGAEALVDLALVAWYLALLVTTARSPVRARAPRPLGRDGGDQAGAAGGVGGGRPPRASRVIEDARAVPDASALEADLCVIGGGAAGITIAREFAGSPVKVVLLESGGLELDGETQGLNRADVGLPYFPLDGARLRAFGGTTHHWGGVCRPFDPIDFERRPGVPHTGWPIDRATLDRYYPEARSIVGLESSSWDVEGWDRRDRFEPIELSSRRVHTRIAQTVRSRIEASESGTATTSGVRRT